jgi:histidinol-phosphate aminotransferase
MSVLRFIKPQVRQIGAYTLRKYAHEIKLDQNENPFGFPDDLKEEVWQRVRSRDWARYTEFQMEEITARIAEHVGFPPEQVLVGNGSNDLIQSTLLVTLQPGDSMVVPQPTFTLYRLMGTIMGAEVRETLLQLPEFSLPVDEMLEAARASRAKVVILCSPNNPTGNVVPEETIESIVENTDALVIIDAAYAEFSNQDLRDLVRRSPRVVLLRTFSKAMAMAGLRIGYMVGDSELLREIAKARLPYSLNHFSETAAFVALDNLERMEKIVHEIIALREDLYAQMTRIEGVRPFRSEANFILFEVRKPVKEVFQSLIQQGVLVRNVSSYPLLDLCLRVTVGQREENARFLRALQTAMEANES